MAFKKGEGGRPRGAKNKATNEVADIIDRLAGEGAKECFEQLARLALQPHDDVKSRLMANRTLIEYRHGRAPEFVHVLGAGPDGALLTRVVHEYQSG